MRSSRCASSTAAALHRIFIAPIEQSQPRLARRTVSSTSIPRYLNRAPRLVLSQQQRCHASSVIVKGRLPRDDEIQSWSVTLVDEDGKLQEPRSTAAILSDIDRKEESLVVLVPGEPGIPPICKIMNKQAMREAEKAKAKSAKGMVTEKTIELNWAIDGNDLNHRLVKMKGFLEKGHRVEVVMGVKRKGRKATEEEGEALLKRIRGAVQEVEGARELKAMNGKLLGVAMITFEGKMKKEMEK